MNAYDDVKFSLDESGKFFGIPLSIVFLMFLYSPRITSILNSHGYSFDNKELLYSYCLGAALSFLFFEVLLFSLRSVDSSGKPINKAYIAVPLSRFFKLKSVASFILHVMVVWPAVAGGFIFLLIIYDLLVYVPLDYLNSSIAVIPFIFYSALFVPVKVLHAVSDKKLFGEST